ncbi:MAG: hypothetical protein UR54_C0011G0011 [Candidatus Roizmanbacteria bacterium GW2011_GWA2_34_18]|uniref:DUF5678 domain-containing protein n=1 Tax=Candidatus Roizmanbacteria bacterium GW2011_GWA2_34_18 TaxID=1618477 RepID=A0A0G0DZJ4_9BACT|nr:MAG: hypothetical protein UR54_C0011G0011 [Candidatus Roizmanbacteria bacterium GW2011_GWA2_34_18]
MKNKNRTTMIKIMSDPKYQGKHVILIADQIYTAKTGKEANKIVDRLEKKFPKEIPAMTYIPKADTLILWL